MKTLIYLFLLCYPIIIFSQKLEFTNLGDSIKYKTNAILVDYRDYYGGESKVIDSYLTIDSSYSTLILNAEGRTVNYELTIDSIVYDDYSYFEVDSSYITIKYKTYHFSTNKNVLIHMTFLNGDCVGFRFYDPYYIVSYEHLIDEQINDLDITREKVKEIIFLQLEDKK